jgi:hypothetical protein
MKDFKPNLEQAKFEKNQFCLLFLKTTSKLLEEISGKFNFPNLNSINLELENLHYNKNALYHPTCFQWHYQIKKHTKSQNKDELEKLIGLFPNVMERVNLSISQSHNNFHLYGINIDLDVLNEDYVSTANRANSMIQSARAKDFDHEDIDKEISKPKENLDPEDLSNIISSFKIIQEFWPEIFNEIDIFIRKYVFFSCKGTLGFADVHSHGMIASQIDQISDITKLAELIIHESSHVRLNVAMTFNKYYQNDEKKLYNTPLREDPRPMYGLFHQLFVLTRLDEFYYRLNGTKFQNDDHYHLINKQKNMALKNILDNAQLTDIGKTLVGTM